MSWLRRRRKQRRRLLDLIVMRLADMRVVHPDQDNSRVCSKCGEAVGIYPSGQAVLRGAPDTVITCNACAGPLSASAILAPGALEEPYQSVKRERP